MKMLTSLAVAAIVAVGLGACEKAADTVKEKADDAKQAVEAQSEKAKAEAAAKIDQAKEKAKEAAPAAAAAVDGMS